MYIKKCGYFVNKFMFRIEAFDTFILIFIFN